MADAMGLPDSPTAKDSPVDKECIFGRPTPLHRS